MPAPVFISYARSASAAHVRALAAKLGRLAFLDTISIDDGDRFPPRLLNGLLDARVVVIFATKAYSESRFCRLEMRLALSAGDGTSSHVLLALGGGAESVLDAMPDTIAGRSWPSATAASRLAALVQQRLVNHPVPLRSTLLKAAARKLAAAFLEESKILDPQSLNSVLFSLPHGVARQSIGARFVGRASDLRHIHQILAQGSGARAQLSSRITAGAGFGKTRLAVEYLHRYGPRYYPGGLFWVNAASSSIEGEFWRILRAVDPTVPNLSAMHQQQRDIREELDQALSRIKQPALYVIDNVPEAGPGEDAPLLEDFCPAIGKITVLSTSRQDTKEPGVERISVNTLGRDAAILLLTEDVPGAGSLSWADWGRIAKWVGDLPVALDILNRSLVLNAINAEDLLKLLNSSPRLPSPAAELDRLGEALRGQVPRDAVHGITEVFRVSLAKMGDRVQRAAMLLAQLAPAPIPKALIDALPKDWISPMILAALHTRHFVSAGTDLSFGVMHGLLADFLRSIVGDRLPELLQVACTALLQVMTPERCRDPQQWGLMNLFRPHAEALFERITATVPVQALQTDVGLSVARLVSAQGDLVGARRLQERVVEARKRMLGEDHRDTLVAIDDLAGTLWDQADDAGALRLRKAVLEARTRILGEEHPETLESMSAVASSLELSDRAGARKLHERVFKARIRALGEEHPDTLASMSAFAQQLDDVPQMCLLLQRVFEVRRRVLGEDHLDTLESMSILASVLWAQGDESGARRLEKRVLKVTTRKLSAEHPDTLQAIENLAHTLYARGNYTQAQRLEESVWNTRKRVLGEGHPDTLVSMTNLARILWKQGDHAVTRRFEEQVLEVRTRVQGEQHPNTLTALADLADTMDDQGDHTESKRLRERVLALRTQTLGEEHRSTLESTGKLAASLLQRGDQAEARRLLERAVEIRRRVLGEGHADTLKSMSYLAIVLRAQGDHAGLRRLREQIFETTARVLGDEHPDTLAAMSELGHVLWRQRVYGEARRLLGHVLELRKRVLGDDHPETLKSLVSLGSLEIDMGVQVLKGSSADSHIAPRDPRYPASAAPPSNQVRPAEKEPPRAPSRQVPRSKRPELSNNADPFRVYLSSNTYLKYSSYQEDINYFETRGGYVQDSMWISLPTVLEQVILADVVVVHPDMGICENLKNVTVPITDLHAEASAEAAALFRTMSLTKQDEFFVSKYRLPHVQTGSFGDYLNNLVGGAQRLVAGLEHKQKKGGSSPCPGLMPRINQGVGDISQDVNLKSRFETIRFEFPLLFQYLVEKSDSYDDLFRIAFDLRETKEARSFRGHCKELDQLLLGGYIVKAARALDELKNYVVALARRTRAADSWNVEIGFAPGKSISEDNVMQQDQHLVFLRTLLDSTAMLELGAKVVRLHREGFLVDVPAHIDIGALSPEDVEKYDGRWDEYRSASSRSSANSNDRIDIDDDIPF
jgi:tetratricopeptide (TPR) repeat protein